MALMPDERGIFCRDGNSFQLVSLGGLKEREIYRIPEGFETGEGASVADDGVYAVVVERRRDLYRLRLIGVARGSASTIVEADEPISHPIPRPRRAGILYRRGGTLWLVNYDGQQNRRLRTTGGRVAAATWSPDGRSVLYLAVQEEAKRLNAIREHVPDTNADAEVSLTSQFVDFDRNADASVFVGASGTRAQPHILLLIRVVKRELTLCEHKASDPRTVRAHFSPNSQRVFFQTDRHGKPSLYCMAVDRLVEATESG
jgi:oligogalacturonide lyase